MADKKGRRKRNSQRKENTSTSSTADPFDEKKKRRSFGLRIRLTPSTTAVIWRERKKNEKARVKRVNTAIQDPSIYDHRK